MDFNVNSPVLYAIVGILIALVLAQSVFFLVRAVKRAKELGIAGSTIKKTISSSQYVKVLCDNKPAHYCYILAWN